MRGLLGSAYALLISVLFAMVSPATGDDRSGIVMGVIGIKNGGPMMDGTVFFFDQNSGPPPSATKYWRVPTHFFPIDSEARFSAVLPEGTYYFGAIERNTGETLGPPQEGDFFFISQDEKGRPRKLTVRKGSMTDLGMVVEAVPFKRAMLARKGTTSIEGVIRDRQGKPVEGMAVIGFKSPTMMGLPVFVSERSDKGGRYLLRVDRGGTYYLRARSNYGPGFPAKGELMGVYKDGKPVSVKTSTSRKGINIEVFNFGM
ncbi:MAG: hypothetical protein A2078_13930 [Nitrospirae bacterium GWC2_57_9]|nr:MAG: hypothetical protein A2078_13930 [Nitrospirae bacterium GWC2_57_9]